MLGKPLKLLSRNKGLFSTVATLASSVALECSIGMQPYLPPAIGKNHGVVLAINQHSILAEPRLTKDGIIAVERKKFEVGLGTKGAHLGGNTVSNTILGREGAVRHFDNLWGRGRSLDGVLGSKGRGEKVAGGTVVNKDDGGLVVDTSIDLKKAKERLGTLVKVDNVMELGSRRRLGNHW